MALLRLLRSGKGRGRLLQARLVGLGQAAMGSHFAHLGYALPDPGVVPQSQVGATKAFLAFCLN